MKKNDASLWIWRVVMALCMIGWLTFAVSVGAPWWAVIVATLVGGVLSWALLWMLYDLAKSMNEEGNDNGSGWDIPAPSKQTQRMLKRNIRRRWF